MTAVPLAVAAPLTSRHSPDWTLLIVPLVLTVHCWLVPPVQSQIRTTVPAGALAGASRHLPSDWKVWPLSAHCWLAPPLQSHMDSWVPLVVLLCGRSRQRPDAALTSVLPPLPPPPVNCHQFTLNRLPPPPANLRNRS